MNSVDGDVFGMTISQYMMKTMVRMYKYRLKQIVKRDNEGDYIRGRV